MIPEFLGLNDLVDKVKLPPGLVGTSEGGYFNENKEFERLKGKLAVGTTTFPGKFLVIQQLDFRDRSVVVFHTSTITQVESDLTQLRVLTSSDTSGWNPMRVFVP
ncbi:MAG: hypothetical protein WC822_01555 [Candidatus Paceibacterota bacterium]|jgi:hypothetical protein